MLFSSIRAVLALTVFSVLGVEVVAAEPVLVGDEAGALPARGENVTTYEYIVIGSGPGGGILAADLAVAGFSVLLIEAGGDTSLKDLSTTVNAISYPPRPDNQFDFFVKHHTDHEAELRHKFLIWKLKNGSFWAGPGADAPPGAVLLGVE
jgi:choline dehydrogenase